MQTNTFMYPSINTKVWSALCYCCADAVFILEYIANTSHCEIFFFIFMESRIMNASKCSFFESATMSDPAIFWPRFSDAANGALIVLYPIHI